MKLVPNSMSRNVARQVLTFKKQSPHIFFVGGIVGFVGTTVLACKATLHLSDVVDEFNKDVEQVKGLGKDAKEGNTNYIESEYYRDMAYVYGKGSYAIVRLYTPAIGLGIVSVGALTGSHVALARRNTALTAALVAVTEAYDAYRQRVIQEIGDTKELDLYYDLHEEKAVDEDGKKVVLTLANPNKHSVYARFFDEYSQQWEKNAEYNRLFVQSQQTWANNMLQSRGHVFLNEVYDSLGIERSQAGSVVGWVLNGDGDNYVDFGMFEVDNRDFVNGTERSILLDFNVDGVIFDKI